jgi:16S rRNA (guanine527-N7)-methyltransferase
VDEATRARIEELAARWALPGDAADRCARLLALLAEDPTAPSTVTAPHEAVDVHLADSLVALELDAVRAARRIADLGSGAGFPGLPLAMALPAAHVDLVESAGRKGGFLRAAIAATGTPNAAVLTARAEELAAPPYDLVTARALAPLGVLAEYAAPLLDDGGALVAWKGARDAEEERAGAAAAAVVGL